LIIFIHHLQDSQLVLRLDNTVGKTSMPSLCVRNWLRASTKSIYRIPSHSRQDTDTGGRTDERTDGRTQCIMRSPAGRAASQAQLPGVHPERFKRSEKNRLRSEGEPLIGSLLHRPQRIYAAVVRGI